MLSLCFVVLSFFLIPLLKQCFLFIFNMFSMTLRVEAHGKILCFKGRFTQLLNIFAVLKIYSSLLRLEKVI